MSLDWPGRTIMAENFCTQSCGDSSKCTKHGLPVVFRRLAAKENKCKTAMGQKMELQTGNVVATICNGQVLLRILRFAEVDWKNVMVISAT